jgi:hypothetical protein
MSSSPRVLVALSSCQSYENDGRNQSVRDTWLKDLPEGWDYRFFHGRSALPKDDVIVVNCDDGMNDLTHKTQGKLRWAVEHGYDFVFCCFPDTYACVERLVACGFENHDYVGTFYCHPGGIPYCQGGAGYFLSRRAAEIVAAANLPHYIAEDCIVGDTLFRHNVRRFDCADFHQSGEGPLKRNTTITSHLSTRLGGHTVKSAYQERQNWVDSLEEQ